MPIQGVEAKTIALLARDGNIKVESVPGGWHPTYAMQTGVAPFDNVDVRLALKHATNREELVEKVLFGHGIVGNDHPIAPNMPFYGRFHRTAHL